jgi:general stress protein YciG
MNRPLSAIMFRKGHLMPRNDEQQKGTSNRGFASMDREKQRAIASKGGQSVPPEKRSFSQDPHLAAQAGRKGGESVPPEGRSFSQNRELAAEAGRKGGQARGASSQRAAAARGGTTGGMQEAGKAQAKSQGQSFQETRDTGAEGARKSSLPKDQMDMDQRNRFSGGGSQDDDQTEELEARNDPRSGGEDVEQGMGPGPGRPGHGTGHPHNPR